MLLLTLSCRENKDKVFEKMVEIKEKTYNSNGVNIGIYEYMNNGEDYLSLYCNDEYVDEKFMNKIRTYNKIATAVILRKGGQK